MLSYVSRVFLPKNGIYVEKGHRTFLASDFSELELKNDIKWQMQEDLSIIIKNFVCPKFVGKKKIITKRKYLGRGDYSKLY